MTLVTKLFMNIEQLGLPFPSNFDISFFMRGIKIALEIEHTISTPRTLYLFFKTLHLMPLDQRSLIIQELLTKKQLHKLFFSWSYAIRDLFFAVLLYQIEYLYVIRTTELLGLTPDIFNSAISSKDEEASDRALALRRE